VSKQSSRTRFTTKPPKVAGNVVCICSGVLVSIMVSIGAALFLSFVSVVTENTYIDGYIQYIMVGVTMISIFIGSVYAAHKAESKGLWIGMSVGLLYVLISISIGMEMSQEYVSVLVLANKCIAGIAAGIVGGLLGVNL